MTQATERAFETHVEEVRLGSSGWKRGAVAEWDKERALFPARVFAFLQDTQGNLWQQMRELHGPGLATMLIAALVKELDIKGTLHVLRHGFNLPLERDTTVLKLGDEVGLQYYRLERVSSGAIPVCEGPPEGVKSPTDVGTGKAKDEKVPLSEIIQVLNDRFGTSFTEEDRLFFEQIKEKAVKDEKVIRTAAAVSVPGSPALKTAW